MGIQFYGGERIQKGRGIGGLLRLLKSVFMPAVKTVGKSVMKAAKSNTGKLIGNALKEQAIESGINLTTSALRGENLKKAAETELQASKQTAAKTLERIQRKRKAQQQGKGISLKKMRTVKKSKARKSSLKTRKTQTKNSRNKSKVKKNVSLRRNRVNKKSKRSKKVKDFFS